MLIFHRETITILYKALSLFLVYVFKYLNCCKLNSYIGVVNIL